MLALCLLGSAACGGGSQYAVPTREEPPPTVGQPVAFDPATISTGRGEGWITLDPEGEWVVFDRHDPETWRQHTIYVARRQGDGWSVPIVAPFSGEHEDRGARFSPDGQRLIFSSNRPPEGKEPAGAHFDLWLVEHDGARWGEPRPLSAPVNSPRHDFHASIASDGTIYFSRYDGQDSELYRATPTGSTYAVESLGPPVNSRYEETDVYIDPDQRFLVFVRTEDPAGFGGDDLWVSFRTPTGWSKPRNLGPQVNSSAYEYGPWISVAEQALYFSSARSGNADLMRIPIARLPAFAP